MQPISRCWMESWWNEVSRRARPRSIGGTYDGTSTPAINSRNIGGDVHLHARTHRNDPAHMDARKTCAAERTMKDNHASAGGNRSGTVQQGGRRAERDRGGRDGSRALNGRGARCTRTVCDAHAHTRQNQNTGPPYGPTAPVLTCLCAYALCSVGVLSWVFHGPRMPCFTASSLRRVSATLLGC